MKGGWWLEKTKRPATIHPPATALRSGSPAVCPGWRSDFSPGHRFVRNGWPGRWAKCRLKQPPSLNNAAHHCRLDSADLVFRIRGLMPPDLVRRHRCESVPIDFHDHRVDDHRRTGRELATTTFDDSAIPPSFVGHSNHLTVTDLHADQLPGHGGSPKQPTAGGCGNNLFEDRGTIAVRIESRRQWGP
jgi:hypothetical protein